VSPATRGARLTALPILVCPGDCCYRLGAAQERGPIPRKRAPAEMKKILLAYSNPWSFSLAVERQIARQNEGCRIDVVNLARLSARHSPHWRRIDRIAEKGNRKFERFILPVVNGRDITSQIRVGRGPLPPLPRNVDELRNYRVGSAAVGLAVLSSVTSVTTVHRPGSMDEYGPALPQSWRAAHASVDAGLAVRELGYDEVYIFNGRHCFARPFCDLVGGTATVYRYEQGGAGNRFIMSPNSVHDPAEIARIIAEHEVDMAEGERFFEDRLRKAPGNPVAFFTSGQQHGRIPDQAHGREIVSLFTSSSDELIAISDKVSYGAFTNQYEVAMALARAAARRGAQLVVRLHPHLQYKHPSWRREWDFDALRDAGAVLLEPSDPTDTYALIRASRCVFTCGSTVGFESAYLGIPVAEVGTRVAGLLGATARVSDEKEAEAFIASPALPQGARAQTIRFGSYARGGGFLLPELDPGTHPYFARIDGRVVDPIRYGLQRLRSPFSKQYVPLPPGGKLIIEPSVAKAMGR
jgi:hypothetical protein